MRESFNANGSKKKEETPQGQESDETDAQDSPPASPEGKEKIACTNRMKTMVAPAN